MPLLLWLPLPKLVVDLAASQQKPNAIRLSTRKLSVSQHVTLLLAVLHLTLAVLRLTQAAHHVQHQFHRALAALHAQLQLQHVVAVVQT